MRKLLLPVADESNPPFVLFIGISQYQAICMLLFSSIFLILAVNHFSTFTFSGKLHVQEDAKPFLFFVFVIIFVLLIGVIAEPFFKKEKENKIINLKNNFLLKWYLPPKEWLIFWDFNYQIAREKFRKDLIFYFSFLFIILTSQLFFFDYKNFHAKSLINFTLFSTIPIFYLIWIPKFKARTLLKVAYKSIYPIYLGKTEFYVHGQFYSFKEKCKTSKNISLEILSKPVWYIKFEITTSLPKGGLHKTVFNIPLSTEKDLKVKAFDVVKIWQKELNI